MRTKFAAISALIVIVTVLTLPSFAKAANDPCGPTIGQVSGYNNGASPTPPKAGEIRNPVVKVCQNGMIAIKVGEKQTPHFGYRVGDIVPIHIEIIADKKVTLDFSTLQDGKLTFTANSLFETALPATVRQSDADANDVKYEIDLRVRTWSLDKGVPFILHLRYAIASDSPSSASATIVSGSTADAAATVGPVGTASATNAPIAPVSSQTGEIGPIWQVLETPVYTVTTSTTADDGALVQEGGRIVAAARQPYATIPLMILGLVLALVYPMFRIKLWLSMNRPVHQKSKNEIAWTQLEMIFARAFRQGFTEQICRDLSGTLRWYFGHATLLTTEVKALKSVSKMRRAALLLNAYELCDIAIETGEPLESALAVSLKAEVVRLIPKPWWWNYREQKVSRQTHLKQDRKD